MCFNVLFKKKNKEIIDTPCVLSDTEPLTNSEVYTLLHSEFPTASIYLSDREYVTTTAENLKEFLRYDTTDTYTYASEMYDCDDFSFRLMGMIHTPEWGALSFGIIWVHSTTTTAHALNVFIDAKRTVWLVEPQNDTMYRMRDDWKGILVLM